MRQATYTNGQFVDQVALNTLSADANSSIQQIANRWDLPGLIHPEAIGWATSGLVVTATCPAPFAVQFASGVVAQALGTTNGATGSTYNINLSSFVPGAGSATVYILASYNQLSLTPETIVGPPQGNPAYNPTFTQFQWYSETVDSIAIAGSSGAANNTSTFELARLTLTAGQSSISLSALNYANQIPSSEIQTSQAISVTGSTALTRSGAGLVYEFTTSGVTATLPLAAQSNGYEYYFFGRITSGYATITGNGTDLISGLGGPGASGTSISILPNMAFGVRSNGTFWETFIEAAAAPIVWNASGTPPSPLSISASGGVQTPYGIKAGSLTATGSISGTTLAIADSSTNSTASVSFAATGDSNGINVQLIGNGSTTPNKTIRVNSGIFNIIDSAYSQEILTLTDAGNLGVLGTVTAVGGTSGNQVVNFNQFGFNGSSAGYQKLPSGFIIQWGQNSVGAPTSVTFPITFPNACLSVVVCEGNANAGTWGAARPTIHGVQNPNTTGYIAWAEFWNGSGWGGGSLAQNYLAVGY